MLSQLKTGQAGTECEITIRHEGTDKTVRTRLLDQDEVQRYDFSSRRLPRKRCGRLG
ncbi:hypothetical protein [Hymenobacter algoricola]|uniref:Uncharacterized protein n=1 Tax=Hymenobacter algoricola TaxID=486267 RepID=A0ABP7N411_9BACT